VYGMSMDMIVSLHQLVGNAIILTGQKEVTHQKNENQNH
jgi:hypothetical protein